MNRKLTKQEKEWLIRGLKFSQTETHLQRRKRTAQALGKSIDIKPPDLKFYLDQIDELRVVHKCKCGEPDCHTIRFQHWEAAKTPALVDTQIEGGRMLIVHVHKETKLLAKLQII